MGSSSTVDVVVIGGGIAGVSAAYELGSLGHRVALLEAETSLAVHTTGRSAAMYLENYGPEPVRRLSIASRTAFAHPDPDLVDGPLWWNRPMLEVAGRNIADELIERTVEMQTLVPTTQALVETEARAAFPPLRPGVVGAAMLEPDAMELDVAAIHQMYVRGMASVGCVTHLDQRVVAMGRSGTGWSVQTNTHTFSCNAVVNAAGAWCDRIAKAAGVQTVGLRPLRRTACVAAIGAAASDDEAATWPLVSFSATLGVMEGYCKPEPGGLLVSPADEAPDEPRDAKPEELDVARGLDVINRWTTLDLRHVRSSWAGLRSFVADRVLVIGEAPDAAGFFWLAGQGGYGIQSAPAAARALAGLIHGGALPDDLVAAGLTEASLAADRPGLDGSLASG